MSTLVGIFVGGKSSRMGGQPKGLLRAPDDGQPLVVRSARLCQTLGLRPVLIGAHEPYRSVLPALPALADDPAGVGPLGGLRGLLQAATSEVVLVLACDMPYLSSALLTRLLRAEPAAQVLAPRSEGGLWEPLCARYHVSVLPALEQALTQGVRSFQALLARVNARELSMLESERAQLRDWDTPEDVRGA